MVEFEKEKSKRLASVTDYRELYDTAHAFMRASTQPKYSYNFSWLGRPIIQYPQDIVALQELIWSVKPDLIIETGIAHGGSLILSASILALLDLCKSIEAKDNVGSEILVGKVLGIDIDIRAHNRAAIEAHPLASRIQMIQGSSIAPEIIAQVHSAAKGCSRVLLCSDSNHTHDHVLAELYAYAPLVSVGSYCVVFDTIIEALPADLYPDRVWGPGNSPKSALTEYLKTHNEFEIDEQMDNKLLISVALGGYLRRTR